jgi:hypothetical protein
VSVSDAHRIETSNPALRIHNIANLPPSDFEQLVLATDLVMTDNEIGYTLCMTIGRVPAAVLVNSYNGQELLETLEDDGPVRRVVSALESERPGSIYPFKIFPIPAGPSEFADEPDPADDDARADIGPNVVRLGRMQSSPFTRVEIYGGDRTRRQLQRLLCDRRHRGHLRRLDQGYIEALNRLQQGVPLLEQLMQYRLLEQARVV